MTNAVYRSANVIGASAAALVSQIPFPSLASHAPTVRWRYSAQAPRVITEDQRRILQFSLGSNASRAGAPAHDILRARFAAVRALKSGWDGRGSIKVSRAVLDAAEAFLGRAFLFSISPAVPAVVPAGDGSLQLEWRLPHLKLELYFDADGSFGLWAEDRVSRAEVEFEGKEAEGAFAALLKRLELDGSVEVRA